MKYFQQKNISKGKKKDISEWKRHPTQSVKSCDILMLSDLVFFLSFKTDICKSSSWCQRYFQAGRTAHPTGAGSSRSSAATPTVLCFLHLQKHQDVSKFSSHLSALFSISTHFSHKGTTAFRIDTVGKKNIFSLTCKVKTLNKKTWCFAAKKGMFPGFQKGFPPAMQWWHLNYCRTKMGLFSSSL